MNTDKKAWESVTEWIIGAAMEVQCVLGVGFLEKVYEKALFAELRKQGLEVKAQVEMPVFYKGKMLAFMSRTCSSITQFWWN